MKKLVVLFMFLFAGFFIKTANATFVYTAQGQRHTQYVGNNTWEVWCTEPWNLHCFTIVIDNQGHGWLYFTPTPSGNGINIGNDFTLTQSNDGDDLIYKDSK